MQIKIPFIYINVMHWFSYFRHYHTRWNIQESGKLLTAPSTKLQNIFSITLTYHFNTFLDHSWTLHMIAVLLFFLKKRTSSSDCWSSMNLTLNKESTKVYKNFLSERQIPFVQKINLVQFENYRPLEARQNRTHSFSSILVSTKCYLWHDISKCTWYKLAWYRWFA